jgi:glyoxylase-like metal-dependent hydrolase (beta-lactamase superfamily II)
VSVELPTWCRMVRADNPGPMTLDGTNTYVLSTPAGNVVVDPGPLIDEHLEAVAALGPVVVTLLTHGHLDHSEASGRFHEMSRAPVLARDPELCLDGDPLRADGAAIDVPGLDLRVLHTPGHSADSVCFSVSTGGDRAVLTGDTILGRGTTVVAHPDGRLGPYLGSLARLREVADAIMLPGHGPVRADTAALAGEYLAHRAERLAEVRAALVAGARTPRDVVEIVYAEVDRSLWPAAELSVRAQLEYLAERGLIT